MKILAILPFDLRKTVPEVQQLKLRDRAFIKRLPAEVCFSFRQAQEILDKNRFSYDVVLSTYTYDQRLTDEDIVPSSRGPYGSARHHVTQILTENPFATVVLWTGAGPKVIALERGIAERITVFDRTSEKMLGASDGCTEMEMRNLRATIADALTEIRISVTDQDDIAVSGICSRAPVCINPVSSSTILPVRPCLGRAFRGLEDEIGEFQDLIDKKEVSEREVELFLRSHPHFLLGNRYRSVRWQIHLKREAESKGPLIPDILLEPISASDHWKIQDLKAPALRLTRMAAPNREGFNSQVLTALHQLREYRDYFDNPLYRRQLSDLGITAYKPEISVVIGRDYGGLSTEEIIKAKSDFGQLEVLTYADLVERLRNNMMWMARAIDSTIGRHSDPGF